MHVVFVLTDLYDSDNYITIKCKRLDRDPLEFVWQETNCYITANAVGQAPTGLEKTSRPNDSRYVEYAGTGYLLHRNDDYGAGTRFSLSGVPHVEAASEILPNETVARVSLTS